MNPSNSPAVSRRDVLRTSATVAAATAFTGMLTPAVHAAGSDAIQVALVGCGGRGSGAAVNALSTKTGELKLVAMADVFENRLKASYQSIKSQFDAKVDVPAERQFVGFDAYQKALDCLKPGDIAIFATPPAFRWVHFGYAIEKGINVFMEKPVAVDGPSTRRVLDLAIKADAKKLKVGVGLMCRHCEARGELAKRIQDGQLGDIIALRAYRMHGPVASFSSGPKPTGISELMYQIQRFHSFLWASGGCFSDFYIHNIDECCWMKNAWPVKVQSSGGRHFRGNNIDQNFDNYSCEYTFDDGAKLLAYGRCMPGCHDQFASYVHGTKGSAVISESGHWPSKARIFKGQKFEKSEVVWEFGKENNNPYQMEWEHLVDAVKKDTPYNEARRGAEASLVTAMGRIAAHTGQIVTYDDALASANELGAGVDKLVVDGPAPILANADGKYPVPQPGITNNREY